MTGAAPAGRLPDDDPGMIVARALGVAVGSIVAKLAIRWIKQQAKAHTKTRAAR